MYFLSLFFYWAFLSLENRLSRHVQMHDSCRLLWQFYSTQTGATVKMLTWSSLLVLSRGTARVTSGRVTSGRLCHAALYGLFFP